MFSELKVKFLFKCSICNLIVSIELENEEDIVKVREDEMVLDCPCGEQCLPLRD